jgi:hypothetical protein
MSDKRIGANQNSFDPAKDGGTCPDAEGETQNCQNGEAPAASEHACAKSDILKKFVRPHAHALFARDFFGLLDSAELSQRRVARFMGQHSRRDVSFDQKIDMLLNFFRHLGVTAAFLK